MLLRRPTRPLSHVGTTPSRECAPMQRCRHVVCALDKPVTDEHANANSPEDQETTNPGFGIGLRAQSPIYGGLSNGPPLICPLGERGDFAFAVCSSAEGES
eukprot:16405073-Heterocapsa_arctica.AAC.1